jgi:hypothetical protein
VTIKLKKTPKCVKTYASTCKHHAWRIQEARLIDNNHIICALIIYIYISSLIISPSNLEPLLIL